MTEQQLLEELKRGSRAAQRELYDRYAPVATAVGRRYVSDSEALHDVLQDSFVKVFTSVADFDFRGEGSLKAWVTRIVANMAVSHLRRASRFEFVGDIPDELEPEEPDVGTIPMNVLMEMIASLPTGYRTVFNLYVFEQLRHKQIARLLGIKESTSASQYLRAKRMMARKINEYKQHSQ